MKIMTHTIPVAPLLEIESPGNAHKIRSMRSSENFLPFEEIDFYGISNIFKKNHAKQIMPVTIPIKTQVYDKWYHCKHKSSDRI